MDGDRHKKLNKILQSIIRWEGLVAVLSRKNDDGFLQVYLTENLAPAKTTQSRLISLEQFLEIDLNSYDDLIAGFPTLDIFRTDLLTRGPGFYHIEHLFKDNGQNVALKHTVDGLDQFVNDYLNSLPESTRQALLRRARVSLIKSAIRYSLNEKELENLVALFTPPGPSLLLKKTDCRLIYARPENPGALKQDLTEALNQPYGWVAGFRELGELDKRFVQAAPVEMREVLRFTRNRGIFYKTLQSLVAVFWQLASVEPAYKAAALKLKANHLLIWANVDDLTGICLRTDVEKDDTAPIFYIFRFLHDAAKEKGNNNTAALNLRISINELSEKLSTACIICRKSTLEAPQKISCNNQHILELFTFPALNRRLADCLPDPNFNLGRVLADTWKEHSLARTFWLLSRDLLQDWEIQNPEELVGLTDISIRAAMLYGILNPWEWNSRSWESDLERCYADLNQNLKLVAEKMQAQDNSLRFYFTALQKWFNLHKALDLAATLEEIRQDIKIFRAALGMDSPEYLKAIEFMEIIAEELTPTGEDKKPALTETPPPFETTRVSDLVLQTIQQLSGDWDHPNLIPSKLFIQIWQSLQNIRNQRQLLFLKIQDAEELIVALKNLKTNMDKLLRLVFAPPHEMALLQHLCDKELTAIEKALNELTVGAKLNLRLKNPKVYLGEWVDLNFEVVNQGRYSAANLEIILNIFGLEINPNSPQFFSFPQLPPNEKHTFFITLRPVDIREAGVRLTLSYTDNYNNSQSLIFANNLIVLQGDTAGPALILRNPYHFGTPIRKPDELYGRKSTLQELLSGLLGGGHQNTLLAGPRRIGKTSVLLVLQQAFYQFTGVENLGIPFTEWDKLRKHYKPVYVSLQQLNVPTSDNTFARKFFRHLLELIIATASDSGLNRNSITQIYNRHLERGMSTVSAFSGALKQVLQNQPDVKILVLLDEYDEIFRPGEHHFPPNLREIIQHEPRLTWIISSTLALYNEVSAVGSPFFNAFNIKPLSRLPREDAVALVKEPSQTVGARWDQNAVNKLLDYTGSRPAYVQLFCQGVLDYLIKTKSDYVLPDYVEEIAGKFVHEPGTVKNYFEQLWEDLPGYARLILLKMIEQNSPTSRLEIRHYLQQRFENEWKEKWNEEKFKKAMDWLGKIADVIYLNGQNRFDFSIPLFGQWLSNLNRQNPDLVAEALDKLGYEQ